ncbi:MAG TPA: CBS domain-containing protein, partial [Acetobacteraceae bacterium]|nr:CBS domain-containing protein [Acetobacteraceae bacterium]
VGGLLAVDAKGKLLGLVTERDVQFRDKPDEPLKRVMTTKLITAPADVGSAKAREILRDHKIEKLPLVDKDGMAGSRSSKQPSSMISSAARPSAR